MTATSTPLTHALPDAPLPSDVDGVRVLVVDDHAAVRLGVQRLIDELPRFESVVASSGEEALATVKRQPYDIAVVDYQLGHGEDGLSVTCDLKRSLSPPRVLIYSAYADTPLAALAMVAGADGILSKGGLGRELCAALRDVLSGAQRWPTIPQSVRSSMSLRLPLEDRLAFRMWTTGASDTQVAQAIATSPADLEHRRRAILRSLGGPPGMPRLPWDDGAWPLSYARARRLRGRR